MRFSSFINESPRLIENAASETTLTHIRRQNVHMNISHVDPYDVIYRLF